MRPLARCGKTHAHQGAVAHARNRSLTVTALPALETSRDFFFCHRVLGHGSSGKLSDEGQAGFDQFPRSRPEAHVDAPPLDIGNAQETWDQRFEVDPSLAEGPV